MASDNAERIYRLRTTTPVRDKQPADGLRVVREFPDQVRVRTGNSDFDALHALAVEETRLCAVEGIRDAGYRNGASIPVQAFETGELWPYVWTRDLAYSLDLGLARMDPERAVTSLLFKTSRLKPGLHGGAEHQILQDTGSGGSYPVSTDRCVWALGAGAALNALRPAERPAFRREIDPFLQGTIEQDLRLVFDPVTGLYRGEQSFLDWREQTYPPWTRQSVLPIAMSFALSVNAGMVALLEFAGENARALGGESRGDALLERAAHLRKAVRCGFVADASGLLPSYLFSEAGEPPRPVARYDLLGLCLAILHGIVDEAEGRALLSRYPTGAHGPPVAWPLERGVDIYHNQGIWPFVTAYWLRAAVHSGHGPARDAAIRSLATLAAQNLSNMENFDFRSGLADAVDGPRRGPVINSRRQLWSVAGYLAMVHEGIFGLDLMPDSLRFHPVLGGRLCHEFFPRSERLSLVGMKIRGRLHDVEMVFPPAYADEAELRPASVICNGREVGTAPVPDAALTEDNRWEIRMEAAVPAHPECRLAMVDVNNDRALFAPDPPTGPGVVHDPVSGFTSHPGAPISRPNIRIPLMRGHQMSHPVEPSGLLAEDAMESRPFVADSSGTFGIRAEYANGHGPVNTGITCAVKRMEVLNGEGEVLASGPVVMPHTGSWKKLDLSSLVGVRLEAGHSYRLRLSDDPSCRNMSYLAANADYTAWAGGGPGPCNSVWLETFVVESLPNPPTP